MASAIQIAGLTRRFEAREALRGVDLQIQAGEIYGLVGPNGAGKTTLFRILIGLSTASSGSVSVLDGAPTSGKTKAGVGYMTQAEALYTDLTVRENLRFFGRLYGLSGSALDEAVAWALDLVKLDDRADSRVLTLSGGMRRRTSLACAILHRPKLMLLDEPTVGVDPELRAQFWDAFVAWAGEGATLVIATHHLDEAIRSDRLGLLREGRLIAQGAPDELLAQTGASTLEEAFLAFARSRT